MIVSSAATAIALNTLRSILAPATPSLGCGKPLPADVQSENGSFPFTLNSTSGGGERRYSVHIPSAFPVHNSKPAPLIIVFHAFQQTAASIEEMTRFSYSDSNQNFIAVYPEGINNVWLGDPGAPNSSIVDDRPFVTDLLDTLESQFCIDTSRIYTTGFSNGGGLSGLLACYPPTAQRIAAFSGVSAAYYTQKSLGYALFEREACDTGGRKTPIPFLDIHGASDDVIAYDGDNSKVDIDGDGEPDPDTLPIETWLGDWAFRNGCPSAGNQSLDEFLVSGTVSNATVSLENGEVTRSTWTCGQWQDVVVGYHVRKLGHGWPSTVPLEGIYEEFRHGPTNWNATAVLLDWFSRWSL